MNTIDLVFRTEPVAGDPERVEEMVKATGFFREDETAVAVELVREKLEKAGEAGMNLFLPGKMVKRWHTVATVSFPVRFTATICTGS